VARPLRGGIPRLLPNHCTPTAVIYRRHFQALAGQFGPFTGNPFLTDYAGRVALAFVTARESGMDLARARTARERGTGRRPSGWIDQNTQRSPTRRRIGNIAALTMPQGGRKWRGS